MHSILGILFLTPPASTLALAAPATPSAAFVDSVLRAVSDTSRRAVADSARRRVTADSLATGATSPAGDSLQTTSAPRDSAVVITTRSAPPRKGAKAAPEPPYRIEADRMSGGRGPEGDVLFLEQVTITRAKTRLKSEHGRYERATGMVYMNGNVRLRDSSTTMTCDEASFSETEDRLDLRGNVVVLDHEATLRAPVGWYDRKAGVAQLTGGVSGEEKKLRLTADEAFYERDSMIVRARGHVVGLDEASRTRLEARAVDFDRKRSVATATGEPLLRGKDDDGKETVLRARLLRVNSETKFAEAIDSVVVERDTLRASANYAFFDDVSGHGMMLGNPRAWDTETTITGDTLETFAVGRKLERIVVTGRAAMDYAGTREGNRGETSRLTGSRVDMYVNESRIDSLVATGSARNSYTAPARDGKTAEANLAKGDTIVVFFKDKKIDRARVQGGASGEYRPPVAVNDTAAARLELVEYEGRHIDFVIPKNRIVLDGDAHLNYREIELRARRVEFDSEKNTLVAEGRPQLVEKGDEVEGQLMTYDMDRRSGTIYKATTQYEKGFYHGQQIRKATDNRLDVLGGAYSTCDLDPPHYHFSAKYMKVYLKDKLVAKSVVFYLRNVPILGLPFYVFPIKPGRHSGFTVPQFEFGFSNETGQFVRNAGYYWAPSEYWDFTGAGDYYQEQPAWALRGELNYKLLYAFDGHFEGRFERNELTQRDDYQFYGTHQQTLGQRTRLSALGNFISSREYSRNALSAQSLQDRLNRFLSSNLQFSHYADWISLNALVDRREDLDADVLLRDPDGQGPLHGGTLGARSNQASLLVQAPSLSVGLPTRALGSYAALKDSRAGKLLNSTYLSLSGRFLSQTTRFGKVVGMDHFLNADSLVDSSAVVGSVSETRRAASTTFSMSDSRRLFGWINFSPTLFGNAVLFDKDKLGKTFVPAAVYQTSAGLSTTLYRKLNTPVSGLAMRHVVVPAVSISYSPDFPNLQYRDSTGFLVDRFQGFGDIGIFSGRRSARASFSLDQRFQAKLTRGEKLVRLDNLLSWTTSGTYDFLWKENHALHPFGPLTSFLRLQPPGYVNADASAGIDMYSQRPLRTFNYNVSTNMNSKGGGKPQASRLATEAGTQATVASAEQDDFNETWTLALAYSYAGGYSGPSWQSRETLNGVLRYTLTENWVFDYQAGYDITERQVLLQRYNLTRRIHCWDATFTRSFLLNGGAEYYFRIGIRDQKEVFYQRGTREQSFGGLN